MDNDKTSLEMLFEKLENLSKTTQKLWNLKVLNGYSEAVASLTLLVVQIGVLMLCVLFFNLGLALLLNNYFEKLYIGFIIIAFFNLFIALFFIIFLKNIIRQKIQNNIIARYFDDIFDNNKSEKIALENSIELYLNQQKQQIETIKVHLFQLESNFQPINIIKNSVSKFAQTIDIKTNLMVIALQWVSSFFAKKSKYRI